MPAVEQLVDGGIVIAAFLSAVFWLKASGRRVRRVSRCETLDHMDVNRLVIALNRAQILNARAALATAIAAALAMVRLLLEYVQ